MQAHRMQQQHVHLLKAHNCRLLLPVRAVWRLTFPDNINIAVDLSGVTEISVRFQGTAKPLTGNLRCPSGEPSQGDKGIGYPSVSAWT